MIYICIFPEYFCLEHFCGPQTIKAHESGVTVVEPEALHQAHKIKEAIIHPDTGAPKDPWG